MCRTLTVIVLATVALIAVAAPGRAACQLGQLAQLSATIQNSRAIVPVQINGEAMTMIVDSGAFYSTLSLAAATHAKLPLTHPFGFQIAGVNGSAEAAIGTVKEFRLANLVVPNIEFVVGGTDMDSGAVGLLGQNFLGWHDVEYDLGNGIVRLFKLKDCNKKNVLAYWAKTEPIAVIELEPVSQSQFHTVGDAYLNGKKIRIGFDTGAPTTVLDRRTAEKAGFKVDRPDVVPLGAAGGLGSKWFQTWSARFDSFAMGGEEIRNARLRVADTSIGGDIDMLVGLDFFLSHHIFVSNDQRRMYFTYNGGPVFNLEAVKAPGTLVAAAAAVAPDSPTPPVGTEAGPATAAEFSRRGMALAARHDYAQALENLNRACELDPENSTYLSQRGGVQWQSGNSELALKDFDQALALKHDNLDALVARMEYRRAMGDIEGATSDLDAAASVATKESNLRLQLGGAYEAMDLYHQAIGQYDLWIAVHPEDLNLAAAYNARCWARAMLGEQLDLALSDCNRALSQNSKLAAALDSRGLVRLRRGEYKKALADYNDALALQPKIAWSLYGRGLTKLHLGMNADGQADLQAAMALQPKIAEQAASHGIGP